MNRCLGWHYSNTIVFCKKWESSSRVDENLIWVLAKTIEWYFDKRGEINANKRVYKKLYRELKKLIR